MFMLLTSKTGGVYVVKKTDIRRVTSCVGGGTIVWFRSQKDTPISVDESVADFYKKLTSK